MESLEKKQITVRAVIVAPVQKVWQYWNTPAYIMKWYHASIDWHTPHADNDLRVGGKFNYRMEATDGSYGFDYEGEYTFVIEEQLIEYSLADGRHVKIEFIPKGNCSEVVETFDTENINPLEMQRNGWQAIIDNFKNCVETI